MPNYIMVRDRESQTWHCVGTTKSRLQSEQKTGPRGGRRTIKKVVWNSFVYPVPESVSSFVDAHKIIEANNEEAACQALNSV